MFGDIFGHSLNGFDKLVNIDLIIAILVDLLHNIADLRLKRRVYPSLKHQCNLLSTYPAILVPVEQVKSLPQLALLLFPLLLESECNKLAELQTVVVIDIQFAESL